MTIRLPPAKTAHVHVRTTCQNLLFKAEMTIRETAQVIGLVVSMSTSSAVSRNVLQESRKE